MAEEWRTVPGFDDYEASDQGRIRRRTPSMGTRVGRIKTPHINQKGYHWVSLIRDGRRVSTMVHIAVALAFVGPRPAGHETNHKDGVKSHNIPENLEWVTHAENMAHAVEHQLWSKRRFGEHHHRARLTEAMVIEARRLVALGHTRQSIADAFGVYHGTIGAAVARKTWRHLR